MEMTQIFYFLLCRIKFSLKKKEADVYIQGYRSGKLSHTYGTETIAKARAYRDFHKNKVRARSLYSSFTCRSSNLFPFRFHAASSFFK